jgi:hypothetical protein
MSQNKTTTSLTYPAGGESGAVQLVFPLPSVVYSSHSGDSWFPIWFRPQAGLGLSWFSLFVSYFFVTDLASNYFPNSTRRRE